MIKSRPILAAALAAMIPFLIVTQLKPASHDRNWAPHFSRTSDVVWRGDTVELTDVRDWSYGGQWVVDSEEWLDTVAFSPSAVEEAWLVVIPLQMGPLAEHTLVLFSFEDGRMLGLSVDPRRRRGELSGPVRGLLNGYELHYDWGTARDHLLRRTYFAGKSVWIYKLNRTPEALEAALLSFLEETGRTYDKPRFYNTVARNCTTEMSRAFDLPWHYSDVFTGYADRRYYESGFAGDGGSFAEASDAALAGDAIVALADLPRAEFDNALRAYLRSREARQPLLASAAGK